MRKKKMAEEREWMKRIQEENAHLKNQIRLLKENYELRVLLGQQSDSCNQVQLLTSQIFPAYPDADTLVKGAGPYTGREDASYSPHIIPKETTALSFPSAQAQVKLLHKDAHPFQPRSGEKKSMHLSSMSCSTIGGKQLEATDVSMLKKTWLTDGPFPGGDKAPTPLALSIAPYKAGRLLSSKDMPSHSSTWPEELNSSSPTSMSNKEEVQAQTTFLNDHKNLKGSSSSPGISEMKAYHLLCSAQDSNTDKTQLEFQEMPRKKKVWFSDAPAADKLRKFHTFHLNDIAIAQNSKRNGRIVGEIAFQLDRRILAHVFPGITRLYGFTVSNIPEKIKQVSMKSLTGSVDEKKYQAMTQRYLDLTVRLEKMGYQTEIHPLFSEYLINTYGILKQRPDLTSNPVHNSPADLRKIVIDIVPSKFLGDTLLLLNCLCELSKEDNKALFAW